MGSNRLEIDFLGIYVVVNPAWRYHGGGCWGGFFCSYRNCRPARTIHLYIYIYYAQHTCICRYCINDPVLHIYIYYKHYIGCANWNHHSILGCHHTPSLKSTLDGLMVCRLQSDVFLCSQYRYHSWTIGVCLEDLSTICLERMGV